MKNILKKGITGNTLKLIALVTMVLDHIGYYFASELNFNVLVALRWLGRMAMPIYTYLIVQGFFYTKDFKKYITRIFGIAVVTQICTTIIGYIGYIKTGQYYPQVCFSFNILFTYTMLLIILKLMHEKIIIKKWNYTQNLSARVLFIIVLSSITVLLSMDYSYICLVLGLEFYMIEKLKTKYMIKTERFRQLMHRYTKLDDSKIIQMLYIVLILLALIALSPLEPYPLPVILAVIPIALYSGERGNKSKILKYSYYFSFPIQHVLLYTLAIMFVLT